MNKQEFIQALRKKLSNLPEKDAREYIRFYEEMINDRIEDGFTEAEAIKDVGTIDQIYSQILTEVPLYRIVRNKFELKRKSQGGRIALIASTSIVWVPLLISLLAVVISLYAALWSIIASFWAVFVSLAASVLVGAVIGILNIFAGDLILGLLLFSCGIIAAGLSIFAFYGSLYSTKGSVVLTKKIVISIKNIMLR